MRFLPWLALSLPSIQRESSLHARAPSPALMRRKSVERANFISPKLCTKEASAARRGSGKGTHKLYPDKMDDQYNRIDQEDEISPVRNTVIPKGHHSDRGGRRYLSGFDNGIRCLHHALRK